MTALQVLTLICGYLICFIVGVLGLMILWQIYRGNINLSRLISEPTGDASMSRFQFLVFTFVIALSLFLVIVATSPPSFPNIPGTVLTLLGISGSSYLVSKGIQFSDPAGVSQRGADIIVTPAKAMVRYGQSQQFKADVPRKPGSKVHWEVIVPATGGGTIDDNGLYRAPDPPPTPPGQPYPILRATIQGTSDEFPDAYDVAVVSIS